MRNEEREKWAFREGGWERGCCPLLLPFGHTGIFTVFGGFCFSRHLILFFIGKGGGLRFYITSILFFLSVI